MNIFYLDYDVKSCAIQHCDKHVVKMITEYAQLLSTCHRVLDGQMINAMSNTGKRKVKAWQLPDDRESVLYRASHHAKHPCNIWLHKSKSHYDWLYNLFITLGDEYEYRYGRKHLAITKLKDILKNPPYNLIDNGFEDPPQAMPDEYKDSDTITAYRKFYNGPKKKFAKWKNRDKPYWFIV